MAQMMEAVLEPPTQISEKPIQTEEVPPPPTEELYAPRPDISHIITEDDEPVDNVFSAKQQRLLVESLYNGWQQEQPFFADANVGIFASLHEPPLVPDVFLSLGLLPPQKDAWKKENRSYFLWEYGKPPEVVVEIISNREGGEGTRKISAYARLGILYYVIYDPDQRIQSQPLLVYELVVGRYVARSDSRLPEIGLGLSLWDNEYEGMPNVWLRWTRPDGALIPTGAEQTEEQRRVAEEQRLLAEKERRVAEEQRLLAEKERRVAEEQRQLAEQQKERADKLAARLQELGIDPATVQ